MQFANMQQIRSIVFRSLFFGLLVLSFSGAAQEKKTSRDRLREAKEKALESITRGVRDTTTQQKSEDVFLPFQGKIIRHIVIDQIGFERSMYDSTKRKVFEKAAQFANNLHRSTREKTIRNNLFIHKNNHLNPYKLADNERYLRDLDFILDARIVVQPVNGNSDSVDLFVITRDVFSLGGYFSPSSIDRTRFGLYDANIDGRGQRLQVSGVFDADRTPRFGYQYLYSKNSVNGSLINAFVSYTEIDNGSSLGLENERAFLLRLDRPLVSPYTRMAGGIELSRNWSTNVYAKVDTSFRIYSYDVEDFWVGYNIGVKNAIQNRNRHFLALRVFHQEYLTKPEQASEISNPIYNDKTFVLGALTFFNQNFYKTRYIYGFGRTEDMPFGKSMTITTGSVRQFDLVRPYVGLELNKRVVRANGDFHEFRVHGEGYWGDQEFEDITLFAYASFFSRIYSVNKFKIRQSISASYSSMINHRINPLFTINSDFGLGGFGADSVLGTQRLSVASQTIAYSALSVLGFRFAPLVFADMSVVAPVDKNLFNQKAYFGLGAGFRTRNENLVFGTIELKFFYFPNTTEDLSTFRIAFSSNLRVKFTSGFVKAPSFIRYN